MEADTDTADTTGAATPPSHLAVPCGQVHVCPVSDGLLLVGRVTSHSSHLTDTSGPVPTPGYHDHCPGQCLLHEVILHVVHWGSHGSHSY